jgi:Mn-dependent DtxR family transcriptional regulator
MGDDLKERVLAYLDTVIKAKNKDVAKALDVKKREVDKVINELAKEEKIEFLYLGTSYVTLKGKYKDVNA